MDEKVQEIFVEDIIPNRFQPRLTFDEKALQELSDSIKVHGVIQPLVLRRVGNKYEIIAGERRYKASCMAGLKKVPAIVREMSDNESAEVALIENVQRKNLSSIEEAQSYKNLLSRGYITQEDLAQKLGVSQPTIANKLRLLNLCDEVQNALLNEQISERHARSLLQIVNPDEQKKMLNRVIKERLTVKQLDMEIKKLLQGLNTSTIVNDKRGNKVEIVDLSANDINNKSSSSRNGGVYMDIIDSSKGNSQVSPEPQKNIFGFTVTPPTDLETTAPNLNVGIDEQIPPVSFNPFSGDVASNINSSTTDNSENNSNNTPEPVEQVETFDMFGDIVTPDAPNNNHFFGFNPQPNFSEQNSLNQNEQPKKKNIGDQISAIRASVKEAENSGFRVEMEEYDFEDMYQMTIKIQK